MQLPALSNSSAVLLDGPSFAPKRFIMAFGFGLAALLLLTAAFGFGAGPGSRVLFAGFGVFFGAGTVLIYAQRNHSNRVSLALVFETAGISWGLLNWRGGFAPMNQLPWKEVANVIVLEQRDPVGRGQVSLGLDLPDGGCQSGITTYGQQVGPTAWTVGVSADPNTVRQLDEALNRYAGGRYRGVRAENAAVLPRSMGEALHPDAIKILKDAGRGLTPARGGRRGPGTFAARAAVGLTLLVGISLVVLLAGALGYGMPTEVRDTGRAELTDCHPDFAARLGLGSDRICTPVSIQLDSGGDATPAPALVRTTGPSEGRIPVVLRCRGANSDPLLTASNCEFYSADHPVRPWLFGVMFLAAFALVVVEVSVWGAFKSRRLN